MTLRAIGLTLALGSFAFLPPASSAQEARRPADTMIDLGTLGHDVGFATSINDRGQVIGVIADNFEPFRASFLWENGVMRELTAGPDLSLIDVYDINDRGQIVGFAQEVSTPLLVVLILEDGVVTRLTTPPDDLYCVPEAINDRGAVLGLCGTQGPIVRVHTVLWRDGEVVDVAPLASVGETRPIAINERGVVLGHFQTPDGVRTGSFVWANGVLTRLDPALSAVDLNNRGQILAYGPLSPAGGTQPLILDRGSLVRLRLPSDDAVCFAHAINDRGDVAGWCNGRAAVWIRGEPKLLPALSEFAAGASDLNERGDVVGYSTSPSPRNNARAVLWPGAARHRPRDVDR